MKTKRYAECRFCGHSVHVTEATEKQTYQAGYDYTPGEYFIGTCPACQMRDCHHVSETKTDEYFKDEC